MSASPAPTATTTARTDPKSQDPRLRGRTYAIPFERVWQGACVLADGGLSRWRLLHADDEVGVIDAEATSLVRRIPDAVHITVKLDENAQTRVDMTVMSPKPGRQSSRGVRLVSRLFRALDARLGATPAQILDGSRTPSWSA